MALASMVFGAGANPWTAIDAWSTGWAEMLRTARVIALEPPSPLAQGRRYEAANATGAPFGDGIWAVVAARRLPALVPGWRVEAEILASPDLGPSHLRACELEATRLARTLSARQVLLRWYPGEMAGREDRVVKVRRCA